MSSPFNNPEVNLMRELVALKNRLELLESLEGGGSGGSGGAGDDYLCFKDIKAITTNGGTFTSGAWQTRDLNTEVVDEGGHGSLSGNIITLVAGTYRYRITVPAQEVDRNQARLYNVTAGAVMLNTDGSEAYGSTSFASSAVSNQSRSVIVGQFTIAATTQLTVEHRCQTTEANVGYGESANLGPEIYTVAEFWREKAGAAGTLAQRATMFANQYIYTTAVPVTLSHGSVNIFAFYVNNVSSPTNGDAFTSSFVLQDGTYTLTLLTETGPDQGILDIYIDGVLAATFDTYSGSAVPNVRFTASVVVSGDGRHLMRGVVNGKNASSSAHGFRITVIDLRPSVDSTEV